MCNLFKSVCSFLPTAEPLLFLSCIRGTPWKGNKSSGHMVRVPASHRYPGELLSEQADIFSLGSTLFEIICGQCPYDGRTDGDIMALFKKSIFPETKHLGLIGNIITGCWNGKYKSAYEVPKDIQAIHPPSNPPPRTAFCSLSTISTISTIAIPVAGLLTVIWLGRLVRR
ncbi:kinase-like protein [Venturia nashicola]|nr:kinase-like protein [Venturia nashicola]